MPPTHLELSEAGGGAHKFCEARVDEGLAGWMVRADTDGGLGWR